MFKFIKAKGPHPTTERQKLQKELFSYRRTVQHGFPHKPTAMAWDPTLRLLCLGTATGAIKVFGQPGVEFYGQHQQAIAIRQLLFLQNQGRIVSLCDDNSLHLWEVNRNSLIEMRTESLEGKLKRISTMCITHDNTLLFLGTEGGNIYVMDLKTFTMTSEIIYQDVVVQNVANDYKLNPGAVESIIEHPTEQTGNNLLIGYNRGLLVLWQRDANSANKTFVANQQLESVCWNGDDDGRTFTTAHNDGSYMVWDIESNDDRNEPITTYGPFACRAIPKLIRRRWDGGADCGVGAMDNDDDNGSLICFMGGMPRTIAADRWTVSVVCGEKHVAFEFTSKIMDFLIIDEKIDGNGVDVNDLNQKIQPEALVVLAEEELVVIDLKSSEWKMMNLPYLVSLHASAITYNEYVSDVPEDLWNKLREAGKLQTNHLYSTRNWPIDGGKLLCAKSNEIRRELLLTGHEDGSVRFWDAGGVTLTPLYKFNTAQYFTGDGLEEGEHLSDPDEADAEWPPFQKIGIFDPYSDDPRLAIRRITLCPLSGVLVVAGTAGHCLIAKFDTEIFDDEIQQITMNIVDDRDGFVWKGHDRLPPKCGKMRQERGFQLQSLVQLHPPAAVTACVLQSDWGLVAMGTAHGLALYDYTHKKAVMVKCTLNPNDLTGGDTPISRRKSFKKSLRESFRRLRKGRSTRRAANNNNSTNTTTSTSPTIKKSTSANNEAEIKFEPKPVERQIEARPVDDSMGSFVRCLYFARTFLINAHTTVPTLWAGTNNGTVYTFTISLPSKTTDQTGGHITCQIAKEIQLKHRAPIIGIAILDAAHRPLPAPLQVEHGRSPLADPHHPHRVVIASEEQFKIFTLPSLKAYGKYKLTAQEGVRVRRMAFGRFACDVQGFYEEIDLLCLTNSGDCLVLSVPDLKRQLNAAAVKREDISGIQSLVFTCDSEALYLHSSSEIQRISLSTQRVTSARCYLELPPGARDPTDVDTTKNTSGGGDVDDTNLRLVNGVSNTDDVINEKIENSSIENGDDIAQNITVSSSVGDITIDSVKDYLVTSVDDLSKRNMNITSTSTSSHASGGSGTTTRTITTVIGAVSQDGGVVTTTTNNSMTTTSSSVTIATTSTSQETTNTTIIRESDDDGMFVDMEINNMIMMAFPKAPLACEEDSD